MKVIHSCTSESFSGLEAYVLELVTWQYRQGKDVELFCRTGSRLEEEARERGIPLWTIGASEKPGLLFWARIAKQWRLRLKADEVVLHMHAGGEPRYHLPVLLRSPHRLIKALLHYHIWINHRKTDPLHRAIFRGIDEVWTSSETARAHLATLLPVARDCIRVVSYGRDVKRLTHAPVAQWRAETRKKLGVSDDDILGVCVSRIEPIKGVAELFDAFVRVAVKYPNAHLALVGNASPHNVEAQQLSEDIHARHAAMPAQLGRRLHLLGFVSPCEPIMAGGDFYVLPSYEECMSLAMLDAAILGLPILGTSSGGTPSIVRPEETGVLVPPRDADALAVALETFYRSPETCKRLGEGARQLGLQFNQDDIFRQIWDWYSARPPTTIKQ